MQAIGGSASWPMVLTLSLEITRESSPSPYDCAESVNTEYSRDRMRFAALRPYGNPNISDHWDVMGHEGVAFEVLAPTNVTSNSTLPRLMRRTYRGFD
jgi:hypothetical protein